MPARARQLLCGHVQYYKILPRFGDFVYCRSCQDFVEVGDKIG